MSNLLLSEDFIFVEILPRIPLKFLVRFTIICKRWRFVITSIDFQIARASYNHSNSTSFLLDWYQAKCRWDRGDEFSIVNKDHNIDFINRINASIPNFCKQIYTFFDSITDASNSVSVDADYVAGSVHGLVCLCLKNSEDRFVIWNPLTKMVKIVLKPSRDSSENLLTCGSRFRYDAVDRDFKIIDIENYEMKSELGRVLLRVQVYSCKLDTWTVITDDSLPNSDFFIVGDSDDRIFVEFRTEPTVLMVFDVHHQVFKRMPCHEHSLERVVDISRYINWKNSLGVVGKKIQYDWNARPDVIYTLDETRSAWILQYTAPECLKSYKLLVGLENGDIVVAGTSQNLELFEAQSSQLTNLTTSRTRLFVVLLYTESLVCVNGMQQLLRRELQE